MLAHKYASTTDEDSWDEIFYLLQLLQMLKIEH